MRSLLAASEALDFYFSCFTVFHKLVKKQKNKWEYFPSAKRNHLPKPKLIYYMHDKNRVVTNNCSNGSPMYSHSTSN